MLQLAGGFKYIFSTYESFIPKDSRLFIFKLREGMISKCANGYGLAPRINFPLD